MFGFNKRKKVTLDIGHSESSRGAYNKEYDLFEYEWNEKLADGILNVYNTYKYVTKKDETKLTDLFLLVKSYRDNSKNGYYTLAKKINSTKCDFCLSLHANAFNQKASGSEVLYQPKNEKSKQLAIICLNEIVTTLGLPDRGVKECNPDDRGGGFLNGLNMPSVIVEPFFIDNENDLTTVFLKLPQLYESFIKIILKNLGYNLGEIIPCA